MKNSLKVFTAIIVLLLAVFVSSNSVSAEEELNTEIENTNKAEEISQISAFSTESEEIAEEEEILPLRFISCYPIEVNSNTGFRVDWRAEITGGSGSYNLSWSGTDGLSGNSTLTSIVYNTIGSKTASVSNIASTDGQVLFETFNCSGSVTVYQAPENITNTPNNPSSGGSTGGGNITTEDGQVIINDGSSNNVPTRGGGGGSGRGIDEDTSNLTEEQMLALISILAISSTPTSNPVLPTQISAISNIVNNQNQDSDLELVEILDAEIALENSENENQGFLLAAVSNLGSGIYQFVLNNWLWLIIAILLIGFVIWFILVKRRKDQEQK